MKLVEKDELEVKAHPAEADKAARYLKENDCGKGAFGSDTEAEIADARYKYISENFSPALARSAKRAGGKATGSDKADRLLTNKWAGIPLFLLILFAIFHCTFSEDFLFLGAVIKPFGAWAEEIGGTTAGGVFFTGGLNSPGVILANALRAAHRYLDGACSKRAGGRERGALGRQPRLRRNFGRPVLRAFFPAANPRFVPLLLYPRGQWVYGARCVYSRPRIPPLRASRAERLCP